MKSESVDRKYVVVSEKGWFYFSKLGSAENKSCELKIKGITSSIRTWDFKAQEWITIERYE